MLFSKTNTSCASRIQFLDNVEHRCQSMLKLNDQRVNMQLSNEVRPQIVGFAGGCSRERESSVTSSSGLSSKRSCFMSSCYSKSERKACRDPCDVKCCDGEDNRPPYTRIMPEDRRFGVVITNEECPCDCEFNCILEFMAEAFHTTQDVASLNFSQCTPVAEFDCSLLLVAEDSDSSDWLLRVARPMCPPYRCTSFIKHFDLVRCTFVIPMIVERRLCNVFQIFENQNCGLDTGKWCVMEMAPLDICSDTYASKVIFPDSINYEIVAYIDNESKEYIEHHCSKLKYITWHLPVDFPEGLSCT
ncbi:GM18229 [Drosophila sechellia]|uniref:GM18229 n=1 Tax=Drosophila sechellia TaxID=7238 RepID=B4I2K4_DROSE|nr:GM18229 [Drosophila sechellia]